MTRTYGFTLIELLITMTLLSMIILIGSSAFGIFGKQWDGKLGNFDHTVTSARNLTLVQDVLDSIVPYVAYDPDGEPIIYFEGNRNGFVSVSSKSVFSFGDHAVIRFSVKQRSDLTYDVLYEEWPMNESVLDSSDQVLSFSEPLILFESVTDPKFGYFGWGTIQDRDSLMAGLGPQQAEWLDSYNGLEAMFPPLKTSLKFSSIAGDYQIISNLSRPVPGLLSRYRTNSRKSQARENMAPSENDCYC